MDERSPEVSAARWDDSFFDEQRAICLAGWRTGAEVDIDEAAAFHKTRPELGNVPRKRAWAKRTGKVLIQPLAGVPTLAGHIALMRYLQDEGGADILPTQIDSLTRTLQFAKAEEQIRASEEKGTESINGFPIVNHGVRGVRKVVEAVDVPIEMRIGTVHPQLPAEIAFAGGISSMTAGPIYYNAHYSRDTTFAHSIRNWQYVFRLIGRYRERGTSIGLQIHGIGNSTPFPNTLLGVCCVLETLIAAAQGARSFSLDSRFMGHMVQDVAAVTAIRETAEEYVRRFGYSDAVITIDRKDWGGSYPEDTAKAYGLFCYNAVSAMFGGVNELISKSIQEAVGIPEKSANADTLRAIRMVIDLMSTQGVKLDSEQLSAEIDLMKLEMNAVLEAVLDLGGGDPAVATVKAFERGMLDLPFAASRQCKGEVMVVRDAEGAVRYLDPGQVPVPARVLQHHRQCIARREAGRDQPIDYQAIVDDIFSISRGYLVAKTHGQA
jgi:methylaspartate mutase epsilon subunit